MVLVNYTTELRELGFQNFNPIKNRVLKDFLCASPSKIT